MAVVTRIAQELMAKLGLMNFAAPDGTKINVADIEAHLKEIFSSESNAVEIAEYVAEFVAKDCCIPLFNKKKRAASTATKAPAAKKAKK